MTATLDEIAVGTIAAAGTASVRIGPGRTGEQWHVTAIRVITTSSTLRTKASVYFGTVTGSPLAATFSGDGDSAGTDIALWSSQFLTVFWSGGDPGAAVQVRLSGEIRTEADGYVAARAIITTPFTNATSSSAAATPGTVNGAQLFDSGNVAYGGLNGPTLGPIDVSAWPTSYLLIDSLTAHSPSFAWYTDQAMTNIVAAVGGTIDGGRLKLAYPNVGPYLRIATNQAIVTPSSFRAVVTGSRFPVSEVRQLYVTDVSWNFNENPVNVGPGATSTRTPPLSDSRFIGAAWYMVSTTATAWTARLYGLKLDGTEQMTIDRFSSTTAGQTFKVLQLPFERLRLDLTNQGAGAADFWVTCIPYTQ